MSELKKLMAHLQAKVANVKSEEEAKTMFEEITPNLGILTDLLFSGNGNASTTDENEIYWIGELQEHIAETIRLYFTYHVKGKLERINLSLSEKCPPVINLTINGQEYSIDFEEIKDGTDRENRDEHRECYYRNESIWNEFRDSNPSIELHIVGDDLRVRLNSTFPLSSTDYIILD
jgi:hypothetical protein